jgi:hypothetical protein
VINETSGSDQSFFHRKLLSSTIKQRNCSACGRIPVSVTRRPVVGAPTSVNLQKLSPPASPRAQARRHYQPQADRVERAAPRRNGCRPLGTGIPARWCAAVAQRRAGETLWRRDDEAIWRPMTRWSPLPLRWTPGNHNRCRRHCHEPCQRRVPPGDTRMCANA